MKQQFENPELEVIELDVRDIIATSGGDGGGTITPGDEHEG